MDDTNRVIVSEVVLDGNQRTKLDFFQHVLNDHAIATATKQEFQRYQSSAGKTKGNASGATPVQSFEDLKVALHGVDHHLRASGLFEDVDIQAESLGTTDDAVKVRFPSAQCRCDHYCAWN